MYYNDIYKTELEKVVKHSTNLMGLIEIKDIVKVQNIIDKFIFKVEINDEKVLTDLKFFVGEDIIILSILTHEQYEQNAYKVEEE